MVSILSPGVYLIEKDISNYPPSIGATTVGIVGYATKGPTNKATLITSQDNLVDTFGYPTETIPGQGLVGALEILETTNSLYYVRAAASDAKEASATIAFGACPAVGVSSVGIGVTESAVFKVQVKDHTGANGFSETKVYTVFSGTATSQQEALAQVFGTDIDTLKVTAQFPYTYKADGNILPIEVTSVKGDVSSTAAGFIVGSYAGGKAELAVEVLKGTTETSPGFSGILLPLVEVDGTFSYAEGTSVTGAVGEDLLFSSVYNVSSIKGFEFDSPSGSYLVESLYPGTGYNLGINDDGTIKGNSIEIKSLGGPGFTLTVNESGGAYEVFRASLLDSNNFLTDVINVDIDNLKSDIIMGNLIDGSGLKATNPGKLPSFVSQASALFASNVPTRRGDSGTYTTDGAPRFVKPIPGTYALVSGTNGENVDEVPAIIGDSAAKTGIYALDDDLLNLTIALVPGLHDQSIQNALITLAESTTNFMAVVAPPKELDSVQRAIDWTNGFSDERTSPINSSYAAIYWPHVQVYVPAYAKDTWLDPAIYGARQIVYTAATSQLWFAPAGFIRGRLTKPTAVEVNLGQGERDAMYSGGNAINPIVNFPQQGITIFGQRTAQRNPTALDRINVRLLAIYLKKLLLASVQSYLFEPNDPILWERVADAANLILAPIKANRGISEYRVKCDETTNTPLRVDRNELWCKVIIKPTKTAEAIVFELNLTSQSATIN